MEALSIIPDLLPRSEKPNPSQEEVVAELFRHYGGCRSNVYLRGSVLRNEQPYGDVDLIVIAPPDSPEENMPDSVLGIPVSTSKMTLEQLSDYSQLTPRAWYLLTENLKLGGGNEEVDKFLEQFKERFLSELLDDYILYLTVEHHAYSRREDILHEKNYYTMKRIPGSKRSIMRGIYLAKAMQPELYGLTNTDEVIAALIDRGEAPEHLARDARVISATLSTGDFDSRDWQTAVRNVSDWVDGLINVAISRVQHKLPPDYMDLIKAVGQDYAETGDIFEKLDDLLLYRQWTVLFAYASNPCADPQQLLNIWHKTRDQYGYKVIERFLLRNNRFPVDQIDTSGIRDFHSRFTLGRRALNSSVNKT